MSDLIPIGQFAALTSLSPKALRLYHDEGILVPASVDPRTGYRYYAPEQIAVASRVALLRRAGISLAEIARFLAAPSKDDIRRWKLELQLELTAREQLLDYLIREPLDGEEPTVASDTHTQLERAIPVLASLDLEATQRFYADRLGFEPGSAFPDYATVQRDGVEIHFWLTDDPAIPKQTACYVRVTGVDALYAELSTAGVVHPNGPLTDQPWGQREFAVLDADGNLIRFGERLNG